MTTPPAGWYPDPQNPGSDQLRWWDGQHWGTPTHRPATGLTDQWSADSPSSPPPIVLPGSGMRPIADFFADIGAILRRGWKQILGISFIVWLVSSSILLLLAFLAVDLSALRQLWSTIGEFSRISSDLTPAQEQQIVDELAASFPRSLLTYAVLGGVAFLVSWLTTLFQTAAVNRVAIDAASQQPVSWTAGWRGGAIGMLRLAGFWIMLTVLAVIVWGIWIGATVLLWTGVNEWFGALVAVTGLVAVALLTLYLLARLVPVLGQAPIGGHIVRWSWQRTKGKSLAVLGRWLLWGILASIALQALTTALFFPFSVVSDTALASDNWTTLLPLAVLLSALSFPFYAAISGLSSIGAVPIWRDLTDDERYRSIDESGQPIRDRSQS